jgi:hypothetical protein
MIIEKTITQTVQVQVCSRPMHWAVVTVTPFPLLDPTSYDARHGEVIAQFHSETDAKFFVDILPPQGLEVRKIVSHDH